MNISTYYSPKFKEKINYINKLDNDDCKFLYNIYLRIINKQNLDIEDYLNNNNCTFEENTTNIMKKCTSNNCIMFELNNDIKNSNLYNKCKENDILILNLNSVSLKKLKNMCLNKSNFNIFLNIDISLFTTWYNWDAEIENNFTNMLNVLNNIPLNKLKINTEEKIHSIVTNKYTYKNKQVGINIYSFIKKLNLLLKVTNFKNKVFTNIYNNKNSTSDYHILELSDLIHCITINSNTKKHQYIYDTLCHNLEKNIEKYNYCLFEDNMCIAQRAKCNWPKNTTNGCCFDVTKNIMCEHLNCKSCNITCISCRLFTCKYLKDRGVNFDVRKNLLTKTYFNLLQKPELIWNFFTDKEEILKKIKRFAIKK